MTAVIGVTAHQQREAIRRRDKDAEMLRSIARSYNVSAATNSRLGGRDATQTPSSVELDQCELEGEEERDTH